LYIHVNWWLCFCITVWYCTQTKSKVS
jgi:hypothetical protein